jgi:hypothetical protein
MRTLAPAHARTPTPTHTHAHTYAHMHSFAFCSEREAAGRRRGGGGGLFRLLQTVTFSFVVSRLLVRCEQSGLLTYDRLEKADFSQIKASNDALLQNASSLGFSV